MSRNFSLNKAQYITVGCVLTIGVLASLLLFRQPVFGVFFVLTYVVYFGFLFGNITLSHETSPWRFFFSVILFLSSIIIVLSSIYLLSSFSTLIVAVVLVLASSTVLYCVEKKKSALTLSILKLPQFNLLHLALAAGYGVLFWRLFSRRLGDTLISPWTLFGPKFFLLFFIVTAILLFLSRQKKYLHINLFFVVIQYTLTVGVVFLVYKHGFGFDPFIHQAAESIIQKTGIITPKQPYYIGQYMLTLFGASTMHLSIPFLDALLTPAIAATALPLVAYRALRDRIEASILLPSLILLPLLPLSFFTFTTPNNLALVVSAAVVFVMLYESQSGNGKARGIGLVLSLLACTIHPFIGIPTLITYLGQWCWKRNTAIFKTAYIVALTCVLPIVMWLNSLRLGESVLLHNPLIRMEPFLSLFQKPHWFIFEDAPLLWQALYTYRLALIPLLLLIALVALWKRRKEKMAQFFFSSTVAIFASGFLLSTVMAFPDVISYEQGAYGSRMLSLSLILMLPYIVYGMSDLLVAMQKRNVRWGIVVIIAAALLTASWYFTYPTRDPVSLYTGYAVRDADVEVVNFITNRNVDDDYIVLTNQTVSAAAIKEKGFFQYHETAEGKQYAYAVPTGGPLYQFFRKMVYEEPKRQWMEEAMDFANVDRAYFVHTNYWAPAAQIRDAAKLEADAWWELAGGRAWVYEYVR